MSAPTVQALAPRPGAASGHRMILAHAQFELGQLLRNGEQLLLTAVIPTGLLILFSTIDVVDLGPGRRVNFLLPGLLALAVLSTAFTGQAIGTGFERRYGVLKRLGSTPLPRAGLLAGKTLAVLTVELAQILLLGLVGVALGWRVPTSGHLAVMGVTVLGLVIMGTAVFTALALLMAGSLRAEATLAAANVVYLVLLLASGIVVPLTKFPATARTALGWLPSTALADGLRAGLASAAIPGRAWFALLVWLVVGAAGASAWFRWE